MAAVYAFIFRRLVEAGYRQDEAKLADAIRLLEIERQTWQRVCQQTVTPQRVDQADRRSCPGRADDPRPPRREPGTVSQRRPVAGGMSLPAALHRPTTPTVSHQAKGADRQQGKRGRLGDRERACK